MTDEGCWKTGDEDQRRHCEEPHRATRQSHNWVRHCERRNEAKQSHNPDTSLPNFFGTSCPYTLLRRVSFPSRPSGQAQWRRQTSAILSPDHHPGQSVLIRNWLNVISKNPLQRKAYLSVDGRQWTVNSDVTPRFVWLGPPENTKSIWAQSGRKNRFI